MKTQSARVRLRFRLTSGETLGVADGASDALAVGAGETVGADEMVGLDDGGGETVGLGEVVGAAEICGDRRIIIFCRREWERRKMWGETSLLN